MLEITCSHSNACQIIKLRENFHITRFILHFPFCRNENIFNYCLARSHNFREDKRSIEWITFQRWWTVLSLEKLFLEKLQLYVIFVNFIWRGKSLKSLDYQTRNYVNGSRHALVLIRSSLMQSQLQLHMNHKLRFIDCCSIQSRSDYCAAVLINW